MNSERWGPALFGAVLGAALGSFALVLVLRLGRGESLVAPGSHCDSCAHPLAPYENVPILSWLALGGRCRICRAPISRAALAFELTGALVGAALTIGLLTMNGGR